MGDLRLVGGNYPSKGRLEIYHNSTWGTICDDGFTTPDANVACRQLGYRTSSSTSYMAGGGTGPIWLDDMSCDGTERRIDKCSHRGWNTHDCGHGEDVGVRCTGEYDVDGQWGSWQEWEICNTTCGNGTQQRIRKCDSPSPYFGGSECIGLDFDIQTCYQDICPDIQLQSKEDTPNSFSSVVLGAVAVVCIVVTAALTCIALFVFHRFRPSKNSTRNINGGNSESLAELQHDQRGYDRPIRASGIQINVYDTINNENNVSDNTQFIADSMNTGEHANILCNANNIETSAHANSPCNAENIETGAHAKIPCNADNVDHVYENLKIF
ncbi:scavenger receptor cysteine-rich type 1 protein M130-like [Mytilus edulis]|uniref:scavenger receptor cysteine-rich type 1 protein M130-like n=1 Tax=Mytilus edulis TaxID=6550 RepID=UPI0039EFD3E2